MGYSPRGHKGNPHVIAHEILFKFLSFNILIYFAVVVQSLSHVGFFVTPWTVAHQAPLSVGFSRQE